MVRDVRLGYVSFGVCGTTQQKSSGYVRRSMRPNTPCGVIRYLLGLDHLKRTHRFQGWDFRLTDVSDMVIDKIFWPDTFFQIAFS